jgi:endonuclease/exonuclease/phosphatase family metal-dependent hydrolase
MDRNSCRQPLAAILILTAVGQVAAAAWPAALSGAQPSSPVTLRLMTFNVWETAGRVSDGYQKTLSAIADADADVVGVQESGGRIATDLALDLGWFAYQGPGSVAVLSRFPISETFPLTLDDAGLGARIRVNANPVQDVIVYVCHLSAFPYGPYSACLDGLSTSQVLADETQSGRVQQISDLLNQLGPFVANADSVPIFLMGDFNTPSHLDWTPAAAALHCGYAIEWPVTSHVESAGLVDSYREMHPDPVSDPGNTWSPIYQTFVYPDGKHEPLDRIDLIHHAGAGVTTLASEVFTSGTIQQDPNYQNNGWPSDHAAVVSTFSVVLGDGTAVPPATLALNKTSYKSGETIVARFANGPGNATDWIGLQLETDLPGVQPFPAWFYTNNTQTAQGQLGLTQGEVVFDGRSAPVWPLPRGSYRALFFCCDGYSILAGPVAFKVLGGGDTTPTLPSLSLDKATYTSGETIVATFANGPGNATDWIGIYRAADSPGAQPAQTWAYTNNRQRTNGRSGPTAGQVVFDNHAAPVWPLPAGDYQAYFLCCDGYTILAGPIALSITP